MSTTPQPGGITALQLAVRWQKTPAEAREWLRAFEKTGYAERRGAYWFPTAKALKITGFGPAGE